MCHVLIIEDDKLIALDIEDILAALGAVSFDVAESEGEAVSFAEARRPDIITADVILKAGLGPSAVRSISARYGWIPTIYITSTPDACSPSETVRVLRKPVSEIAVSRAFQALRPAA